jgi:transposase-like protein
MTLPKYPAEVRQAIVDAALTGATYRHVAESFGVSYTYVRNLCRQAGISVRPHGDESTISTAVGMVRDGQAPNEVGEIVGFSGNTIRAWCRRHGVELRTRSKAVSL